MISLLVGVLVFFILGIVLHIYNKFIRQEFLVKEAWSGVDVQLKRRHDLIPNLVSIVQGYAEYESETLEDVIRERRLVESAEKGASYEKTVAAEMKTLFMLAEAYPDLKADKNFREFQSTLTAVEDDLQYARRYYNGTVRDFNILAQSFPSNSIAYVMGIESKDFFEVEYVTERSTPEVQF